MNLPGPADYIDIHTHSGTIPCEGVFSVVSLMAHENIEPVPVSGIAWTFGIHPWYLRGTDLDRQIEDVRKAAGNKLVIALGEAGFDRIKGPDKELQRITFEEQVKIAEKHNKPVVIHCVRAWEELLGSHSKLKPATPWLIHGFRGNKVLAAQMISKGMYLSFWFDFIVRAEASELIRSIPKERIFLETDGSGTDIREIYKKVSADLSLTADELKNIIYRNFMDFFLKKT